jgi:hypothetical protein
MKSLGIAPIPEKPLPPLGSSIGRKVRTIFPCMFTKAAFYSEPPLPCPCDPHGELAVRYAIIYPKLSLAMGWCGNLLRARTPMQSLPVLSSGRATVGRTSHILENHVNRDKVRIRRQDCSHRLMVALLSKVGCRGLSPRLNHTAMRGA